MVSKFEPTVHTNSEEEFSQTKQNYDYHYSQPSISQHTTLFSERTGNETESPTHSYYVQRLNFENPRAY